MGSIRATPLGNVAARYLDVLFSDAGGTIRVTAEAADLSDRTEAFYLTAEDSGPEPRWVNSEGLEAWPPEDLVSPEVEIHSGGRTFWESADRYLLCRSGGPSEAHGNARPLWWGGRD